MINVWLKIRNRENLGQNSDFVMRHLYKWIDIFSDKSLYKIWLYNENFNLNNYILPQEITLLNKNDLLNNSNCKIIYDAINQSKVISDWWKPTSFALSAPYFYFNDDQYIFNIDADDLMLDGPVKDYMIKSYNFAVNNNLETLSYDMLFSQNGTSTLKPNHWAFGINISSIKAMKQIIITNINNINILAEAGGVGINIDAVIDFYLKNIDNYICFITPHKLHHMEVSYTKYDLENDRVEINHHGTITFKEKHKKIILIQ